MSDLFHIVRLFQTFLLTFNYYHVHLIYKTIPVDYFVYNILQFLVKPRNAFISFLLWFCFYFCISAFQSTQCCITSFLYCISFKDVRSGYQMGQIQDLKCFFQYNLARGVKMHWKLINLSQSGANSDIPDFFPVHENFV